MTSVFSADWGDFGPSCTGHQSYQSCPVYCETPQYLYFLCPNPGCSLEWCAVSSSGFVCFTGVYMPVAAFTPVGDDPLYSSLFSLVTDPTKTVSAENFWRWQVHNVMCEVWCVEGENEGRDQNTLRVPVLNSTISETQSLSLKYCGLLVRKSIVHAARCWSSPSPSRFPLSVGCIVLKALEKAKHMKLTVQQ